jgi:hypothetical protein
LTPDDDREKITNLYLAKKNQEFFKINNKVDDINHRQLREIKYYAQNMIYRKLFDEFSVEINRRKKQIQLANLIKNNEMRVVKVKEDHLVGLKKVTTYVKRQIT